MIASSLTKITDAFVFLIWIVSPSSCSENFQFNVITFSLYSSPVIILSSTAKASEKLKRYKPSTKKIIFLSFIKILIYLKILAEKAYDLKHLVKYTTLCCLLFCC